MTMKPNDAQLVGELTAAIVSEMVGTLNKGLAWEHTVFAAAVAIRGISNMAMQMHGAAMSEDQFRQTVLEAVTAGLLTEVKAIQCDTPEQLDELHAAHNQPRH